MYNIGKRIFQYRYSFFPLLAAVVLVLLVFVNNVVSINSMLKQINENTNKLNTIKIKNDVKRAYIVELESAERITKIAETKLGMINPQFVPQVIFEKPTQKE